MGWGWGEGSCDDMANNVDDVTSSVRFTGAPDGYKYDTLNLYEGQGFMGEEQFFYQDQPSVNYDNLGE